MIQIAKLVASSLGVGYLRPASGTWGSAFGGVIVYLLFHYLQLPYWAFGASIFILFFIAVWATAQVTPLWGNDPKNVVIDEVIGMMITMLWVPVNIKTLIIGFFIFRFFDILKPLGVQYFDNMHNAWGVQLDDVLAGFYASICLYAIYYLGGSYFGVVL